MISLVFIQKKNGEFVSPNSFAAWRGFHSRGFATRFFEWPELQNRNLLVESSTLVVGGSGTVRHALSLLGIKTPVIDDLPEELAAFRGRKVWHSTWGEVCGQHPDVGPTVFVKPLRDLKAFPATKISAFRGIIPLSHLSAEMPILVSEPVTFLSEWRFFVLKGQVVGTGWYSGDPLVFPDPNVVRDAIRVWGTNAPDGYGIDFGVVENGATILVEVNEGFSLGCLGLRAELYSQILEARWVQLVSRIT